MLQGQSEATEQTTARSCDSAQLCFRSTLRSRFFDLYCAAGMSIRQHVKRNRGIAFILIFPVKRTDMTTVAG